MPNPKDKLSSEDLEKFDAKTIFYDVFIDQTGSKLVAIGPAAINLSDYIKSVTLYVNEKRTAFSYRDLPEYKISILEAKVKPEDRHSVSFSFPDFKHEIEIKDNTADREKSILVAISKNNKPEWVATWAEFHKHNYDIDEVIVYDNGSDNVKELRTTLGDKAHIINWNFPYGPPQKRFNKFAQPGALNHCLHKFGKGGTIYNFDIDELLIADNKKLEKELSTNGTVYIDSYNVPRTSMTAAQYTHYDFTLRYKEKREKARKFVCRSDSVAVISQHSTWNHSRLLLSKRLRRTKPKKKESRHAYFLHFLAITTNWQPDLGKLDIIKKEGLKEDISHIHMKP